MDIEKYLLGSVDWFVPELFLFPNPPHIKCLYDFRRTSFVKLSQNSVRKPRDEPKYTLDMDSTSAGSVI
jgi:hypothetical protein